MTDYRLVIPGKATGKQRGRTFIPRKGDGSMVMQKDKWGKETDRPVVITKNPDETLDYQALVKQVAYEKIHKLLDRCRVWIIVNLPVRMTTFKTKPPRYEEPLVRPDLDNVEKIVLDALQGIAFKNDKHVMQLGSRYGFAHPDSQPNTIIHIREVNWTHYIVFDIPSSGTNIDQPQPIVTGGGTKV